MKTLKKITTAIFFLLLSFYTIAQEKGKTTEELKIKTSAVCNMCKNNIEKAMAYEKGVKEFNLDVKSQILTVTYNTKKTTPEKIRKAVSMIGYDADDVPADPKAYERLDACCKKDNEVHE